MIMARRKSVNQPVTVAIMIPEKVKLSDNPTLDDLQKQCNEIYTNRIAQAVCDLYQDAYDVANDATRDAAKRQRAVGECKALATLYHDKLKAPAGYTGDTIKLGSTNDEIKVIPMQDLRRRVIAAFPGVTAGNNDVLNYIDQSLFWDLNGVSINNLDQIMSDPAVDAVMRDVRVCMPECDNFTYDAGAYGDVFNVRRLTALYNFGVNHGDVFIGEEVPGYRNVPRGYYEINRVLDANNRVGGFIDDLQRQIDNGMSPFEAYLMA